MLQLFQEIYRIPFKKEWLKSTRFGLRPTQIFFDYLKEKKHTIFFHNDLIIFNEVL